VLGQAWNPGETVSLIIATCFFSEEEKAGNLKLCTCVSRVIGSITDHTGDR
jgi:hypothetical protein